MTVTTGASEEVPEAELRLPEEVGVPEVERVSETEVDPERPVSLEG